LPQASTNGRLVTLELSSYEGLLDKMTISGFWRFTSVKEVIYHVIRIYNENKSDAQPFITADLEGFEDIIVGTFDFGDDITVMDALKQLIAYLELPPASGGYGDRFSMTFTNVENNQMTMTIQPQGSNVTKETITPLSNRKKLTRTHDLENANVTLVRGEEGSGSIPTEISEFTGLVEEFENFPDWQRTESYKAGLYVTYIGSVWEANSPRQGVAPNLNNSGWTQTTFQTYSGGIDHSPWTNGKRDVYLSYTLQNKALEQDGLGSPAFVDSNLIIEERGTDFIQQEVMARISNFNGTPPNRFRVNNQNVKGVDSAYEGMKFLCLGTAVGFGPRDKYNRQYKDAVIQMDSGGDWLVIPFAESDGQPRRGYQVAVRSESKMYEWQVDFTRTQHYNRKARMELNNNPPYAWRDVSDTPRTNHCFHYPSLISNDNSLTSDKYTTHKRSAIRVNYDYEISIDNLNVWRLLIYNPLTSADPIADLAAGLSTLLTGILWDKESYDIGWWCTLFESPSPITTDAGAIGDNYTNPVFDAHNVTYDVNGKSGYLNTGKITLGNVQGFALRLNFDVQVIVGDAFIRRPFQGDLPFRATIYDTDGNVWIADKTYRLLGESQDLYFYFDEFSIYYARAPLAVRHLIANITQPELLRTRIPERHKIKRIVLQLQAPYDEVGRYDPARYVSFLENVLGGFIGAKLRHTGVFDAFRFVCTPIKRSSDSPNQKLPILTSRLHDLSNISNVAQLQKAADAQHQLDKHKNDVISIDTRLKFDVEPGNAFLVEDDKIIEGKREYIVTEINYTDSKNQPITRQINAHREVAT